MNPQPSPRRIPEWLVALGAFLTLVTLVVAQPLYALLTANPEFVAVRLTRPVQLLQVVAAFNLFPAAGLFLLWAICRGLGRRPARGFLAAVFFVFLLAFFWQLHNVHFDTGAGEGLGRTYWLWLIPAAALTGLAARWEEAALSSLAMLSPVALALPALFLLHTWPSAAPRREASTEPPRVARPREGRFPLIVIVVFDELTLRALLDSNGEIDAARFPHFAALARTSTWFRNATANASHTRQALPAIVTGKPPPGASSRARTRN